MTSNHGTSNPPFEASRGAGPYIFVSYAHSDADAVYPELVRLKEAGYNIWYDEGIPPGHDWPEELATSIAECALFLLFVTPQSASSDNCSRETTFAVSRQRRVLAIYLEEASLPPGLELSIGNSQAIMKCRMEEQAYERKLTRALSDELGQPAGIATENESTGSEVAISSPAIPGAGTTSKAQRNLMPVAVVLAAIVVLAGLAWLLSGKDSIEENQDLAALETMANQDYAVVGSSLASTLDAYLLARKLEATGEHDEVLASIWPRISVMGFANTEPPGVILSIKRSPEDENWIEIGASSQQDFRFPYGQYLWKLSKPGYHDKVMFTDAMVSFTPQFGFDLPIILNREDEPLHEHVPEYTTHPAASNYVTEPFVNVPGFSVSRYEATNREFKEFVDAGGYDNPEFFKELEGNEALLKSFVDTTGRVGPSTWELGTYPPGRADHPVAGISWYEAMAFARFSGASLPTTYHWAQAAVPFYASVLAADSNMNTSDTVSVKDDLARGVMGLQGGFGNVREWLLNAWDDRRWILGGGYSDPAYLSALPFSLPPEDRSPLNGVRLYYFDSAYPERFAAASKPTFNDYRKTKPISDDTYSVIRDQYVDVGGALNAQVVSSSVEQDWRHEIVRLQSDREGETFDLHLYMPLEGEGPFQLVTYFPPISDFWFRGDSHAINLRQRFLPLDMIPRSGRVLAWPVFYGSFERYFGIYEVSQERRSQLQTEMRVHWYADMKRSLDYLESRDDMDVEKLAYMGYSYGASHGTPVLALESRFKTAILVGGGLGNLDIEPMPHAADPVNFVSRIKVPVVMINGKSDFVFPLETAQRPMFNLLGTPDEDKLKIEYEGDHYQIPGTPVTRDIANWLDKYLGPI